MITLHGHPVSGNAHRVTTMLGILGLDYENVVVDLTAGAHKKPDFLAMNALGQIPVLCDGELVLRDSIAILTYLARQYAPDTGWFPADAVDQARIQQWLSIAVGEIQYGPAALRAGKLFGAAVDREVAEQKTSRLFSELFEPQLTDHRWLSGESQTIADIACYGYLARVEEGDFDASSFTAVQRWLGDVESIDGFVPMMHAA